MPVQPGHVMHFNGYTNFMHSTAYMPDQNCESHWIYGEVTELPMRAETSTLREMLAVVKADLGEDAILELDQELVLSLNCANCNTIENVLKPMAQVSFEAGHCPTCGEMREVNLTHTIRGDEEYLDRTLRSVGVPPLHVLRATNGAEFRFYELTGDLPTALHFNDFTEIIEEPSAVGRVQIGERLPPENDEAETRIHLID
jgi:hypothetical protein